MKTIKLVKRNNWYFGQYRYSIGLYLPGAFYVRSLNHNNIDRQIHYYNQWRTGGRLLNTDVDILHGYCDLLLSLTSDFKTVIHSDFLYVYTSNKQDLDKLINSPLNMHRINQLTEIDKAYDKNFVYLKKPTLYTHRSYLKGKELTVNTVESLTEFFRNNQDYIKPNPRLNYILNYKSSQGVSMGRRFMHYTDFVDHTNGHELLMLNIILPNIVKRTLTIKAK